MNRAAARKIAEHITGEQLQAMFDRARACITNWEGRSAVNPGITKGVAWNILAKGFDSKESYHVLAKCNMVREFGEFLPQELIPKKKRRKLPTPVHQEPVFDKEPANDE